MRALPYPEYRRWQLLYMLEPWGFPDKEYRTAAVIAQLHNNNTAKRSDLKTPDYFMRDMVDILYKELDRQAKERKNTPDLASMDPEARATLIKASMKEFFGV